MPSMDQNRLKVSFLEPEVVLHDFYTGTMLIDDVRTTQLDI